MNAVRHGITSRRDLLPWEDPEKFKQFVQDRLDFFEMETAYEQDLILELAGHEWRLRRLDNYETSVVLKQAVVKVIDPDLKMGRPVPEFDRDPEAMESRFRKLHPLMSELDGKLKEWTALRESEKSPFIPITMIKELNDVLDLLVSAARLLATGEDQENPSSWTRLASMAKAELVTVVDEVSKLGSVTPDSYLMDPLQILRIEQALHRLIRAGSARLWFLQGALPSARERSELLTDTALIAAAIPAEEELEKMTKYRHYLERCIRDCLTRIEAARAVKERVKSSNIRRIG